MRSERSLQERKAFGSNALRSNSPFKTSEAERRREEEDDENEEGDEGDEDKDHDDDEVDEEEPLRASGGVLSGGAWRSRS